MAVINNVCVCVCVRVCVCCVCACVCAVSCEWLMWSGFRILALSLQPLRAKASLTEMVVVSRYIERPLCIDGESI